MEDVIAHKQIVKITLFQNPKIHLKCPITIGPLESFRPFLYTYKKKVNVMITMMGNGKSFKKVSGGMSFESLIKNVLNKTLIITQYITVMIR
jgi:hypothetical protein